MPQKDMKSHIKGVKMLNHLRMVTIHDYFSLGLISRFSPNIAKCCTNSANLCAVARPHDRYIKKTDGGLEGLRVGGLEVWTAGGLDRTTCSG